MSFYTDLRDGAIPPLLTRFGQSGIYTVSQDAYDVTDGTVAGPTTSVTITGLEIPKAGETTNKGQAFSAEQLAKFSQLFLVGAAEFATAGLEPIVDGKMSFGGRNYHIVDIKTIGPGGVPLVYKIGANNA